MKALVPLDSPLFTHLRETAAQGTQLLIDAGFYDPFHEGPDVPKVEALLKPFLDCGRHTSLPDERLVWIVDHQATPVGTAFQALDSWDIAERWYKIGQYGWRGGAHWYAGNPLDLDWPQRESPALGQEGPAICAALAGSTPRAEQLFGWIAVNREKTEAELQALFEERSYNAIWEGLGFRLFALAWLSGRWPEVLRLAEVGREALEKTRKAGYPKDFREPQLLIEIGARLSAYFLSPNEPNRKAAAGALCLDKIPDRDNRTRANMLPYLFALGRRFPEINPYPDPIFQTQAWRPSAGTRDQPLTRAEIQKALDEVFRWAAQNKKVAVRVSSVDLHLRLGGYPGPHHQLALCCEVMREALKKGGKITGQTVGPEAGWLEIYYNIPR